MRSFLHDYGQLGNLAKVRLAVLAFLIAVAHWVTPESWNPWIYGAVAIAAMCACVYFIFFVKRIKPWNRRRHS